MTKGYHGNKVHLSAITRGTEYMEGENLPMIQVMDETSQKLVMKNKADVKSIAQTVYFLAKQGLPLRGNREDTKHLEESMNCGNFQELLEFRCEAGDKNLSAHFESCHRNATHRSKIIKMTWFKWSVIRYWIESLQKSKRQSFMSLQQIEQETEAFKHSWLPL